MNFSAQTKTMEKIDSSSINNQISSVIRPFPLTPCDPQNVVSATLDRIVDVRERLNDINKSGGLGCAVEKQLKVELNIVSRQIQVSVFICIFHSFRSKNFFNFCCICIIF